MSKQVKDKLIKWAQQNTAEYSNVNITDLTNSWKNGLAFCAILHHFDSSCIDYSSLKASDAEKNLDLAFKTAAKKFGIFPLLDVEDMTVAKVDVKLVFTYLGVWYEALSKYDGKNKPAHVPLSKISQNAPKPKKATQQVRQPKPKPAKTGTKGSVKCEVNGKTEEDLKRDMGKALERIRRRGQIGDLMKAVNAGRKVEFMYPELLKMGYDAKMLKQFGVEVQMDLVADSNSRTAAKDATSTKPKRKTWGATKLKSTLPAKEKVDKNAAKNVEQSKPQPIHKRKTWGAGKLQKTLPEKEKVDKNAVKRMESSKPQPMQKRKTWGAGKLKKTLPEKEKVDKNAVKRIEPSKPQPMQKRKTWGAGKLKKTLPEKEKVDKNAVKKVEPTKPRQNRKTWGAAKLKKSLPEKARAASKNEGFAESKVNSPWGASKLKKTPENGASAQTVSSNASRKEAVKPKGSAGETKPNASKVKSVDLTEKGLKAAMGRAMEQLRRKGKTGELLAASRRGEKLEFMYPELERMGYDAEILRGFGVEIRMDVVRQNSEPGAAKAPVKKQDTTRKEGETEETKQIVTLPQTNNSNSKKAEPKKSNPGEPKNTVLTRNSSPVVQKTEPKKEQQNSKSPWASRKSAPLKKTVTKAAEARAPPPGKALPQPRTRPGPIKRDPEPEKPVWMTKKLRPSGWISKTPTPVKQESKAMPKRKTWGSSRLKSAMAQAVEETPKNSKSKSPKTTTKPALPKPKSPKTTTKPSLITTTKSAPSSPKTTRKPALPNQPKPASPKNQKKPTKQTLTSPKPIENGTSAPGNSSEPAWRKKFPKLKRKTLPPKRTQEKPSWFSKTPQAKRKSAPLKDAPVKPSVARSPEANRKSAPLKKFPLESDAASPAPADAKPSWTFKGQRKSAGPRSPPPARTPPSAPVLPPAKGKASFWSKFRKGSGQKPSPKPATYSWSKAAARTSVKGDPTVDAARRKEDARPGWGRASLKPVGSPPVPAPPSKPLPKRESPRNALAGARARLKSAKRPVAPSPNLPQVPEKPTNPWADARKSLRPTRKMTIPRVDGPAAGRQNRARPPVPPRTLNKIRSIPKPGKSESHASNASRADGDHDIYEYGRRRQDGGAAPADGAGAVKMSNCCCVS